MAEIAPVLRVEEVLKRANRKVAEEEVCARVESLMKEYYVKDAIIIKKIMEKHWKVPADDIQGSFVQWRKRKNGRQNVALYQYISRCLKALEEEGKVKSKNLKDSKHPSTGVTYWWWHQ